jgi:hypothetical protein
MTFKSKAIILTVLTISAATYFVQPLVDRNTNTKRMNYVSERLKSGNLNIDCLTNVDKIRSVLLPTLDYEQANGIAHDIAQEVKHARETLTPETQNLLIPDHIYRIVRENKAKNKDWIQRSVQAVVEVFLRLSKSIELTAEPRGDISDTQAERFALSFQTNEVVDKIIGACSR